MENRTIPSPEFPFPQNPKPKLAILIAAGVITLAIGIGIGLAIGKYSSPILPTSSPIFSYDDCVKAKGSRIQESYPVTCVTAESQRFIQPIYTPTITLIETTDPTANWKTFLAPTLKLEFQLPPKLYTNHKSEYGKGGFQEYILPGETGTMVCLTNKKLEPVINNPGANDCRYDIFVISALSIDYTAGRGGSFLNNRGYTKIAGKYFSYKNNVEFHPELIQEIKNSNGVEILKIRGGPLTSSHDGRNPYTGKIGALINTSINNYPGFAILMTLKPEEGLTEEIFDQILSTFRFGE